MGPMFSGKSTQLLSILRKHEADGDKCLLLKHSSDTRYGSTHTQLITHSQDSQPALAVPCLEEAEKQGDVALASVVCIDEGQFYPDIVAVADRWAQQGKHVYVAALDGTFQREPFAVVARLISKADTVVKLHAKCCNCGAPAPFSRRLTAEQEEQVIGGADKYIAACRTCFHLEQLQKQSL